MIVSNAIQSNSISLTYGGESKPQSEIYKTPMEEILKKYYYDNSSKPDSMTISFYDSARDYIQSGVVKYYYNGLNQLIRTEQYNINGLMVNKVEYTYDTSGNIVKELSYLSNGLYEEKDMTYDNKINPYNNLSVYLYYDLSRSKNNLLSEKITNVQNSQLSSETAYTYIYDSDNYPIERTVKTTGLGAVTITERYEYQ